MEPRAAIGNYDPATRRYSLHAGCQSAHQLRTVLAQVLGVSEDALRVIVPDVGGGFGARNIAYPEFVLVLFAAKALGGGEMGRRARELRRRRPGAQPASARNAALDGDGRFLALQVASTWRHGGYFTTRSVFVLVHWMAPMVCGPYRIPVHHFALEGCSPTPRRSRRTAASRAPSSPIFSSASSMPPPSKSGSTASSSGAAT